MGKIQDEFELSKKFELKKNKLNNSILELSVENVAHVEAMIRTDSSYSGSVDPNKKPNEKLNKKGEWKANGSSAFWFKELNKILNNKKSKYTYEQIIEHAVIAVDSENSTHINSDGKGRITLKDRILSITQHNQLKLKELLEDKNNQFELIQKLSEKTIPVDDPEHGKKRRGRHNFSFATKFCHYASYWLFNDERKDKYSIYDGIMSKNIVKYAKACGIDHTKDEFNFKIIDDSEEKWVEKYTKYMNLITEILKGFGNKISRNGFDHLVWYYHKGK